jgi:hypothetical protein
MTVRNFSDQGFDDYRKQRKRMQAKLGTQTAAHVYDNEALRELEQVEAREVRDQRLTREVHDFFAAATKQAAAIVDRVARDAQQQAGEKVEQEMEGFLIDSLSRMNTFVLTVLKEKRGPIAETQMEPSVGNIVGASLDEFRWEGTADIGDKHIGQDPFETSVDDVQREFREQVGASTGATDAAAPIDEHLVAATQPAGDDDGTDTLPEVAGTPRSTAASAPDALRSAPAPVPARAATAAPAPAASAAAKPSATASAAAAAAPPAAAGSREELERFKEALKALVRQGLMTREQAKAAWQARVQAPLG